MVQGVAVSESLEPGTRPDRHPFKGCRLTRPVEQDSARNNANAEANQHDRELRFKPYHQGADPSTPQELIDRNRKQSNAVTPPKGLQSYRRGSYLQIQFQNSLITCLFCKSSFFLERSHESCFRFKRPNLSHRRERRRVEVVICRTKQPAPKSISNDKTTPASVLFLLVRKLGKNVDPIPKSS